MKLVDQINVADMSHDMVQQLAGHELENPLMVGIHTGGVIVAEILHTLMNLDFPLGSLDISLYRDDYQKVGFCPQTKSSNLPTSITGRDIILVDDIIFTGRTVRAAMNELFSFGRPNAIVLTCLLDRGGRQLPIQPDVLGGRIELEANQQVKLRKERDKLIVKVYHSDPV